jgi:hypothetical protein
MKLEFYQHILEKVSNIKFHQNPSGGSRVVPWGRTDGHEADIRFSQICKCAYQNGNVDGIIYFEDKPIYFMTRYLK